MRTIQSNELVYRKLMNFQLGYQANNKMSLYQIHLKKFINGVIFLPQYTAKEIVGSSKTRSRGCNPASSHDKVFYIDKF